MVRHVFQKDGAGVDLALGIGGTEFFFDISFLAGMLLVVEIAALDFGFFSSDELVDFSADVWIGGGVALQFKPVDFFFTAALLCMERNLVHGGKFSAGGVILFNKGQQPAGNPIGRNLANSGLHCGLIKEGRPPLWPGGLILPLVVPCPCLPGRVFAGGDRTLKGAGPSSLATLRRRAQC